MSFQIITVWKLYFYACFGDNYEDELGLNANTNVEQAMTIISAACDREGIKEKMAAQMKSILMRG